MPGFARTSPPTGGRTIGDAPSELTKQLIRKGLEHRAVDDIDVPAIWRCATDAAFADFIGSLRTQDVTVARALIEAARRLRERAA
jgi:hypothetical protein